MFVKIKTFSYLIIFFFYSHLLHAVNLLKIEFNLTDMSNRTLTFQRKLSEVEKCLTDLTCLVVEISVKKDSIDASKDLSKDDSLQILTLLSSSLGNLIEQKRGQKNSLLEKIYNRNDEKSQNSFSHHDQEVYWHTDGSFMPNPPDYVGMWMEKQAIVGGSSKFISATLINEKLKKIGIDSTQILPMKVHESYRLPEEAIFIHRPLFDQEKNQYFFRSDLFLAGIEKLAPNDDELKKIVYSWKEMLNHPKDAIRFKMQNNHFYFFNNRLLLHSRTKFQGDRYLWRTWVRFSE